MELFSRRRRRLISAQVVSCSGMYNTKTLCYTCMATFHSCLTIGSIQIKILPNCNFLLVQISHQIPPTKPFWKDILLQFILLHMTEASCWLAGGSRSIGDPITVTRAGVEFRCNNWKACCMLYHTEGKWIKVCNRLKQSRQGKIFYINFTVNLLKLTLIGQNFWPTVT